ncbi:SDR family oxidoreductase [Micromonospora sp. NPDC005220]|uniref:SDR family oxidoreductase n=1 Tax=Micromonospora sp. NPDC005220 TaxID=3155589 RepID=UPI0033A813C6
MNAYLGRLAGRVATALVAGAVALLASDDAAWITGQAIVCDGGVSLTGRAG